MSVIPLRNQRNWCFRSCLRIFTFFLQYQMNPVIVQVLTADSANFCVCVCVCTCVCVCVGRFWPARRCWTCRLEPTGRSVNRAERRRRRAANSWETTSSRTTSPWTTNTHTHTHTRRYTKIHNSQDICRCCCFCFFSTEFSTFYYKSDEAVEEINATLMFVWWRCSISAVS